MWLLEINNSNERKVSANMSHIEQYLKSKYSTTGYEIKYYQRDQISPIIVYNEKIIIGVIRRVEVLE